MPGSRIALVIHALYGGGAERLMSQLANRWAGAGREIHLITWADQRTDEYLVSPTVQRYGLNLMRPSHGIWDRIRSNLVRVRTLRKTLIDIAPDFVLSFSDQMNIVTLEATRRLGVPVWISEHSNPSRQRLGTIWEAWRRRTYSGCDGCIVLTEDIANTMTRWVPPAKIRVIPPAIDIPIHVLEQATAPNARAKNRTILSVGRLSAEKGTDLLLRAWHELHARLPEWKLRIVGDGEQRAQLEKLASGIPRVEFAGWQNDPWTAYQSAGIFVLPSRYEGFPVALLEAMSQGVACVATECTTAIEHLNSHSRCIEVTRAEMPTELAEAILRVAVDEDLRVKLGQAGVGVANQYQWSAIGQLWDRVLSSGLRIRAL